MDISIGYTIPKPVETQEQCNAYTAMVQAIAAHNAECPVGATLWAIEDQDDGYAVVDGGVVQEPEPDPDPPPSNAELGTRVDALESANDDIILMMADLIGG